MVLLKDLPLPIRGGDDAVGVVRLLEVGEEREDIAPASAGVHLLDVDLLGDLEELAPDVTCPAQDFGNGVGDAKCVGLGVFIKPDDGDVEGLRVLL